jgi:hypothetical protein
MPTPPKRSKRPPSKNQMGAKPAGQGGFQVQPPQAFCAGGKTK